MFPVTKQADLRGVSKEVLAHHVRMGEPIGAPPGTISCCICLNMKGRRIPATTIVKGYSVCDDHVSVVSVPHFDIQRIARRRSPV